MQKWEGDEFIIELMAGVNWARDVHTNNYDMIINCNKIESVSKREGNGDCSLLIKAYTEVC